MQTFLPYPDFKDSALVLDRPRLGKQRLEAKQILMVLEGLVPRNAWDKHPAVKMWRGYEDALALYGFVVCTEWLRRGYTDSLRSFFALRIPRRGFEVPWWLGQEEFHLSHQSNLLRKFPQWYRRFWPDLPDDLPYYWPHEHREEEMEDA